LANAELAFNEADNTLYYGWGTGGAGGTATTAMPIAGPGYISRIKSRLDIKRPCRVTSGTTSVSYAVTGVEPEVSLTLPLVIDGVTLAVGNRVLVANHTNATKNGIWRVSSVGGVDALAYRASDFNTVDDSIVTPAGTTIANDDLVTTGTAANTTQGDVRPGCLIPVTEGTTNAESIWILTTDTSPINIGATGLAFARIAKADPDLDSIAGQSGTGFAVRTADNTWALKTFSSPNDTITVGNGGGTGAGNVTLELKSGLTVNPTAASSASALVISVSSDTYGRLSGVGTCNVSNITLNQFGAPTADVSMGGKNLTNLPYPVDITEANRLNAAPLAWVQDSIDAARQGLNIKKSCAVLANIYNPGGTPVIGTSGVYNPTGGAGAGSITSAPKVVDGVTLTAKTRILVTDAVGNVPHAAAGVYEVHSVGTGSTGEWQRANDFDSPDDVSTGAYVWVEQGSTYADTAYVLTTNPIVGIGGPSGTALQWMLFATSVSVLAGGGLVKSGNTINVNLGTGAASGGLAITGVAPNDTLKVKAGAHLGFDSNGALKVNTNTSGAAIPLLNAVNTWSGSQEIQAGTAWALNVNNDSADATTVTITNVTPNARALEVEGKTVLYKQLDIVYSSPTIKFQDSSPNDTPYAHDFWLHVNNNAFHILTNQNSDVPGDTDTWSTPHPAQWSNSLNLASFYGKTIYGVDAKSNNNGIGIVTAANDVPTLALTGPVLELHAAISALTVGGKYVVGYNKTTGAGLAFSLGAGAESLLGLTNLVVGDLLYASSTSAFSRLPATTAGYVLCSNQTAGPTPAAPFWGKVDLTNHITGWLGVANGGTGRSSLTSNGILYGNNTNAVGVTAAGVWDAANSVGQLLSVNSSGVPTWTNTIDGGSF
jgi:hypothetical protein